MNGRRGHCSKPTSRALASYSLDFTHKTSILLLLESLLQARGAGVVRLTILTWLSKIPKCVSRRTVSTVSYDYAIAYPFFFTHAFIHVLPPEL
jgi:hypothetical protein